MGMPRMTTKLQCKLVLALKECVSRSATDIGYDELHTSLGVPDSEQCLKQFGNYHTFFGKGDTSRNYIGPQEVIKGVLEGKVGVSTAKSITIFREISKKLHREHGNEAMDEALATMKRELLPAIEDKVKQDFSSKRVDWRHTMDRSRSQEATFIGKYIDEWLQQHCPKTGYSKEYDDISRWLQEHYPPFEPKPFTPWPPLATASAKPSAVETLAEQRAAAKPKLCCAVQ
jgi:hypothetical protein